MVWQALRQICRVEVEPVGQATFRPMEVCEVSRWDPYAFHSCRQGSELERPFLPAGGGGFAEGGISSDQGHDFRG